MSDRSGGVEETKGDTGLHDLYRAYSGWLTARLRKRFGDETEDLAQEAWVRATPYSRRGVIRHPKALLMSIVENLAIDRARRRSPQSLSPADWTAPQTSAEPASQADLVLLKQIVFGMPPRLREVFVLSRFVHLEYQEISERLGIPVTTVQWRMIKALEYCAAQLRL
ncbi:MAG: RNA polymerase sigma factor [Caulobacteraceae bacterium]|nr:RNA polymerase sigma factor [Caulobacteraceae bacterium]